MLESTLTVLTWIITVHYHRNSYAVRVGLHLIRDVTWYKNGPPLAF